MSKVYHFASREQIAAEARQWVVALDSDLPLSEGRKRDLDEWLARSQVHREEFERISSLWQLGDVLKQLAILPEARTRRRFLPALPRFFSASWGPRLAMFSIVLVMAGAVGFLVQDSRAGRYQNVYITDIGEISRSVLQDGSVLNINTNSRIKIEYGPDYRAVHLIQGEAHFEVERDAERPFVVYARNSVIEAVGTAFSVNTEKNNTQVVVSEGRVDLAIIEPSAGAYGWRRPASKVGSLGENEVASIDDLGLERSPDRSEPGRFVQYSSLMATAVRDRLAWREGYISLSGEPLSHLVDQLGRYIPQTIKIADPALEDLRIGGGFRLDDLDGLFQVLESDFGIKVTRVNNELILLGNTDI